MESILTAKFTNKREEMKIRMSKGPIITAFQNVRIRERLGGG